MSLLTLPLAIALKLSLSIFLGLFAAASAALPAQTGHVRGEVVRANGGAPVSGATVTLVGSKFRAGADSTGRFVLTVPAGLYEIEARGAGTSIARSSVSVRTGDTVNVSLVVQDAAVELAGVTVLGQRSDALAGVPGSAAVITARQMRAQQPLSANEALRTVPGVHLQDEEGLGLRANIGIRGLDPDRSRTVLVLEDGVPVALAPYGEPEMYYSPPIDRMERVEVIKGSGSILFGPQTIGGVVNYVTADPPPGRAGQIQLQSGTGASSLMKVRYGGTAGPVRGSAGAFHKQANDINGFSYDVRDATGKIGVRTAAGDFGLKLSAYDEMSNATYVGLTDSLFRASPNGHPQPGDLLTIDRYAATASHEIALGAATLLRTSAYGYQTTRDWNRRDYTYGATGATHLFRNTTGSRNRSFYVMGIEPRLSSSWNAGEIESELDAGVRAHYEHVRDQHLNGTIDSDDQTLRDDEARAGRAISAFVQNRFFMTPTLQVTPGVRLEHFAFDRHIFRTRIARQTSDSTTTRVPEDLSLRETDAVSEVIPGIGVTWSPEPLFTLFAGAHRGFAPPRTKDALIYSDPTLAPGEQVPDPVSLQLDPERSWNFELGMRAAPSPFLSAEATLFRLDFSNQIIEPSLSAGAVSQALLANQGATRHSGVEIGGTWDIAKMLRQPYSVSVALGYTYARAEFSRDRFLETSSGDTINVRGNTLPYAPRHRTHASITAEHPSGVLMRLDALRVGSQFSDNFQTVDGSANGRTGLIPAHAVYDFTAQSRIPGIAGLALVASVKNLTDNTYIASRRPEGIKTGLPRFVTAGFTWEF